MRLLAFAISAAVPTLAFAGTPEPPIIGGTQATPGEFPSTVAVEVAGGLCSGTLVTKDWVMTAAHCLSPAVLHVANQAAVTSSVRVHFGTVNLSRSSGNVGTATDTIPNPGFSIDQLGHSDVGLIRLAAPVENITTVPVNLDPANAPIGISVTMVGFGTTAVGAGGSVGIEFVVGQKSIACSSLGVGSDGQLLCFSQTSGTGKCEGDSGGPSFAMVNGTQMQVGITSFGDTECAQFGADTRTDAEKTFLLQHVPELTNCAQDTDCPTNDICFQKRCITEPFTTGGLGTDCTTAAQCTSGLCQASSDGQKCVETCTPNTEDACPAGFDCLGDGASGVCWPSTSGGCCDAGGNGAPTAAAFGMLVMGLLLRRRSRA
jgi:uncharacterized protein (TIGR03382 family)